MSVFLSCDIIFGKENKAFFFFLLSESTPQSSTSGPYRGMDVAVKRLTGNLLLEKKVINLMIMSNVFFLWFQSGFTLGLSWTDPALLRAGSISFYSDVCAFSYDFEFKAYIFFYVPGVQRV